MVDVIRRRGLNFASGAGLAVLVALRYLPGDPSAAPDDYVLGRTEVDGTPERIPDEDGEQVIRALVTRWLEERRSLLAALRSKVLPEADVVMMTRLTPIRRACRRSSPGRSALPNACIPRL